MTSTHYNADIGGKASQRENARRAILAAGIGHVFEWFDFATYGFLVFTIARNFFPANDENASLLATFGAFGVGFVARPFGALLLGRIGDIQGRKWLMTTTMCIMAISTAGIGLLPTYEKIGIVAPALLILLRLIQGFSLGAEWAAAGTFIVEWAPSNRRGLYGSFHQVSGTLGLLLGSLGVAALISMLSSEDLTNWGWRIPFLIGALLGPLAVILRRRVTETPVFVRDQLSPRLDKWGNISLTVGSNAAKACGLAVAWAVFFYIFLSFMPSFSQKELGFSASEASWSNTIGIMVNIVAIPVFGRLSDKFGRRPILMAGCTGFLVLPYPVFAVMINENSLTLLISVQVVFGILLGAIAGPGTAALTELFPTSRRSMLLATTYSVSVAIAGGFAPFIALWLIDKTGNGIAPTYYVMAAALVGVVSSYSMAESAHKPLN